MNEPIYRRLFGTPLRSFLLMIGVIVFLFGGYMLMGYYMADTVALGELSEEDTNELNRLYDSGDFEGMAEYAAGIGSGSLGLLSYAHSDLLNYYIQYIHVRDVYVPKLGSGTITEDEKRNLTECVFSYYYRCYADTVGTAGNLSEDDLKVLDGIRDTYMLGIMTDRMGFSEGDMEAARPEIMKNGYFHTDRADKFSDRYGERYK
ncbi:MAG: hypothetical protein K6G81_10940 [Lachnospiraceae bacterium]|nr:hypothetical protein [Lachnospiraceae bacterium]